MNEFVNDLIKKFKMTNLNYEVIMNYESNNQILLFFLLDKGFYCIIF